MNNKKSQQHRVLALALLALGATSGVHAADETVIQQSFHPTRTTSRASPV